MKGARDVALNRPPRALEDAGEMAKLLIMFPDASEVVYAIAGEKVTVGRAPDNTIQIDESSVSVHHAQFSVNESSCQLKDLGSTNKTWVNGLPVNEVELASPCLIRFGIVDSIFLPEAAANANAELLEEFGLVRAERDRLHENLERLTLELAELKEKAASKELLHVITDEKKVSAGTDVGHDTISLEPALAALRDAAARLGHKPGDRLALHELFGRTRGLALEAQADGRFAAVHCLASTLETFVGDLCKVPEQLDALTFHTVQRAVDTLDRLAARRGAKLNLKKAKICIVSDDAEEPMIAATRLVDLDLSTFNYPTQRLDALAEQECELIVLDPGSRDPGWLECCARLRRFPLHSHTPIVILTSSSRLPNPSPESSGREDFVVKPFNIFELAVKILTGIFRGRLGQPALPE